MKFAVSAHKVVLAFVTLTLLGISCTPLENVKPEPQILISPYVISMENECLTGVVSGIDPKLFSIIIYAFTDNGWHSIINNGSSLITLSEDNSWACEIKNVEKEGIKELAIYLIPSNYSPPVLYGETTIPIKVNLVAATKKFVILEDK